LVFLVTLTMDSFKPLACLVLILALFSIVQGQNCNYNLLYSATTCSISDLNSIQAVATDACYNSGGDMNNFVNLFSPKISPLGYSIFAYINEASSICYNTCWAEFSLGSFNVLLWRATTGCASKTEINMASFNHTIALTPKKV